jgi:alginate O-acetyltransferase complex protein AlgI
MAIIIIRYEPLMLFNSHVFIFVFLPIVLLGFYRIAQYSRHVAALWLAVASLFFYGWWDSRFLGLLLASITFNYAAGYGIAHNIKQANRLILITAIVSNLSLLAYFKYANFFIESINTLFASSFAVGEFFLPLGISFFTFTQIAFLVDTYQGKVKEFNFVHYTLFVTYFPHLIAGPVLHHKEMMPQFAKPCTYRFSYDNIMVGLVIFFIGLFKKVVLADNIAVYVHPVFSATTPLTSLDAWSGALCYSLQLYFDFSGYSDMAIGLSRLFGVTLPLNFHSPYKAVNIIEFWRRWHITLSRFLRDYLYIPLGGNRYGKLRRYGNLMLTMLLGGLWHGAGWTFVLWGGLHGLYLVINHAWQGIRRRLGQHPNASLTKPLHSLATLLTFLAVVIAWVIFRAETVSSAIAIVKAMLGFNGFVLPASWLVKWGSFGQFLASHGMAFTATKPLVKGTAMIWIALGLLIVWFTPNTQQIMALFKPALVVPEPETNQHWLWQPSWAWLGVTVLVAVFAILSISKLSEFIYFQF